MRCAVSHSSSSTTRRHAASLSSCGGAGSAVTALGSGSARLRSRRAVVAAAAAAAELITACRPHSAAAAGRLPQHGRLAPCRSSSQPDHAEGGEPCEDAAAEHSSSRSSSTPSSPRHNQEAAADEAAADAARPAAGGLWDDEEDEDEYEEDEEEEEDADDEEGFASPGGMTSADRKLEAVLRERVTSAAVQDLAGSMFAVGLQGSAGLALGYLLLHRSLLDSFSWTAAGVETGLLWALPAAVVATLLSALPLPTHRQFMDTAMTAGADAGAGSSSSSSREREPQQQRLSFDAFNDARRMATNSALASEIPVRLTIGASDSSSSGRGSDAQLTQLSPVAFTQALRYMQEFLAEPWSVKTNSLQSWALRSLSGVLRRVSVEVFWRGLVVAGLAGWLHSSWESAGTSQDSPLFYARLFGLLTPQCALAVISAVLVATRIPADITRSYPAALYTRLASMEVEVVGRLTEDDWLVMVLPAEVAAAAAAAATAAAADGSSKPRRKSITKNSDLDIQEALTQKVQRFGRLKAGSNGGGTSSSSAGSSASSSAGSSTGSSAGSSAGSQQPPLSKKQMEQQLDKLLAAVQDWKQTYGSSSSSSSSGTTASQLPLQGFDLTPREQAAAELTAEFLELVKSSAAAKAAAATATSKLVAMSAGLPSNRLAGGLETLLTALNDSPQRRLLLLHIAAADELGSSISSWQRRLRSASNADEDSGDESSDEDSDDDDDTTPGSVQAVMRAKARTAAEAERRDGASRSSSPAVAAASTAAGGGAGAPDEAAGPIKAALRSMQGRDKKQQGDASSPSSSSSSSDDDDDDAEEGLTLDELQELLRDQLKKLRSNTGQGQGSELMQYLKASKAAYRVAASIPTAQDRVAKAALLSFNLLEQLAVSGAFVASSGNLAASLTAAAALQVVTATLQQAVATRERQRVRQAIGGGWALQLQMFAEQQLGL